MRQSIWTVNEPSNPQAYITKRKQRIKQFEGQVYLKDGDEFEIEIFNPHPKHILAKIKVDGEYLSGGGIVLRPGERVFLERHLDTAKKFVFKTYEVGKEAVNLGAIDNNGYVEVQFFNEYIPFKGYGTTSSNTLNWNNNGMGTITYTSGTPFNYLGTPTSGTAYTTNTFYNQSLTTSNNMDNVLRKAHLTDRKIETGRTEKGSDSNQTFTNSSREFTASSFWNVAWRLFPISTKQYHKEELSVAYCGECGAKRKKDTFKFCPHCGTKF